MKVLVINGPNLNMLGKRKKEHYGQKTLEDINNMMRDVAKFDLEFFQSNHEGFIIDKIQECHEYDALIINPGGLTHTSVSLRDALEIFPGIKVEVHLSDVDNRDDFRKIDLMTDVCNYRITGKKEYSYTDAIEYLNECFSK